jgi:hypothetical protein
MWFLPTDPDSSFGRRQGTGNLMVPDNGTVYVQAALGESLAFGFNNGARFGVTSVDLAGYALAVPDFSVNFVGYFSDGSTVSTNFSGSGINFQTFYFGSEFTDLTHVQIPHDGWSLDNLVVYPIPEPSSLAVLGFRHCLASSDLSKIKAGTLMTESFALGYFRDSFL